MKALLGVIAVVLAALATTSIVGADESYLCRFTGVATLSGANIPDGTVITAIVGKEEYTTTTPTGYGASTFSVIIQPPDGRSYPDGTVVHFKIGNCPAYQTGTIQAGKNIRLDLTAPMTAECLSGIPSETSSSRSPLVTVGLVFAFIAELSLVGGVAYIAVSDWNKQ